MIRIISAALIFVGSSAAAVAEVTVSHIGSLRAVHQGTTASVIALPTLKPVIGLQALGPVSNMDGEITVIDGRPSVSQIRNGQQHVSTELSGGAAFLVWSDVREWQDPIAFEAEVSSLSELDAHIEMLAKKAGMSTAEPFPFRLVGHFHRIEYHVLNGLNESGQPNGGKRSTTFVEEHIEAEALGFFAKNAEGIYTHRGSSTHVHVVIPGKGAGHLDAVVLPSGKLKVYFPLIRPLAVSIGKP